MRPYSDTDEHTDFRGDPRKVHRRALPGPLVTDAGRSDGTRYGLRRPAGDPRGRHARGPEVPGTERGQRGRHTGTAGVGRRGRGASARPRPAHRHHAAGATGRGAATVVADRRRRRTADPRRPVGAPGRGARAGRPATALRHRSRHARPGTARAACPPRPRRPAAAAHLRVRRGRTRRRGGGTGCCTGTCTTTTSSPDSGNPGSPSIPNPSPETRGSTCGPRWTATGTR